MFNAARAALIASKAPVPPEVAKTHSGLISAFSLHLVADYKGDPIEVAEAQ